MIGNKILSYTIIEKIGEGGMGTVYLAEHNTLKRKAAIKVLHQAYLSDEEIKLRFYNEAVTLAKLNHPNIVTLFDFADIGNNLVLVLEHAEGYSLDKYLQYINGPIPEKRCVNIFNNILSAFSYAHKNGIVHRDIKPSNIIINFQDSPKILDFGIAKIITSSKKITKVGTRMGTVMYMSPEQVNGQDIDQRSDIYSLGVTLYEMLTAKSPYDETGYTDYQIQSKILYEVLPSPRNIYPSVSGHIESIIYKATAKNPYDRFQTCEEFREAINNWNYEYELSSDVYAENNSNNNYTGDKFNDNYAGAKFHIEDDIKKEEHINIEKHKNIEKNEPETEKPLNYEGKSYLDKKRDLKTKIIPVSHESNVDKIIKRKEKSKISVAIIPAIVILIISVLIFIFFVNKENVIKQTELPKKDSTINNNKKEETQYKPKEDIKKPENSNPKDTTIKKEETQDKQKNVKIRKENKYETKRTDKNNGEKRKPAVLE